MAELTAQVRVDASNISKLLRAVKAIRLLPLPKAARNPLVAQACKRWPIYVRVNDLAPTPIDVRDVKAPD